jgi:hypothetical protein
MSAREWFDLGVLTLVAVRCFELAVIDHADSSFASIFLGYA